MSFLFWLTGAKTLLAAKSVENVIVEIEREIFRDEAGDLSGSQSVTPPGLSQRLRPALMKVE